MGESDRHIEYKQQKYRFTLGQPDNALMWLFVFNVAFFLILLTIKAAVSVNDNSEAVFLSDVVPWFEIPFEISKLGGRIWTLLTYMFSDVEVLRTVSNMLWLWAFGSILQNITGNKKLIPVYLYGGFFGAIFFIIANLIIPVNSQGAAPINLLGANAAVLAVAVAATALAPNYRLFRHINGGIPIWVLTVIYILIDLAAVTKGPMTIPVAHIGGAIAGLLFVVLLRKNIDGSVWMNKLYHTFINLFNPHKHKKNDSVKEKVFYNTGNRSPYKKTSNVTEQRVDEILDKISQKGYDQLTKEEKEILKKASED